MTEMVITTAEIRKDIAFAQTLRDFAAVQHEVNYLAEEADMRLEFALLDAEDTLLAIRALSGRPIIEKSTE
jgi:hypothetical protein